MLENQSKNVIIHPHSDAHFEPQHNNPTLVEKKKVTLTLSQNSQYDINATLSQSEPKLRYL